MDHGCVVITIASAEQGAENAPPYSIQTMGSVLHVPGPPPQYAPAVINLLDAKSAACANDGEGVGVSRDDQCDAHEDVVNLDGVTLNSHIAGTSNDTSAATREGCSWDSQVDVASVDGSNSKSAKSHTDDTDDADDSDTVECDTGELAIDGDASELGDPHDQDDTHSNQSDSHVCTDQLDISRADVVQV